MADLTTEVLIQIRDELRATRTELSARLDQTNARLDQSNIRLDRLETRQGETETRLATELIAVADAVRKLSQLVAEDRILRGQVADHEKRISALEAQPH